VTVAMAAKPPPTITMPVTTTSLVPNRAASRADSGDITMNPITPGSIRMPACSGV
jgi:hypothetical protein